MQQVVLNACNGEFSLSEIAIKEYIKRKNINLYVRRDPAENIYFTKEKSVRKYKDDGIWEAKTEIPRTDEVLIDIVSRMGKYANTIYSKLVIEEVDNTQKWDIVEQDGKEEIIYKN